MSKKTELYELSKTPEEQAGPATNEASAPEITPDGPAAPGRPSYINPIEVKEIFYRLHRDGGSSPEETEEAWERLQGNIPSLREGAVEVPALPKEQLRVSPGGVMYEVMSDVEAKDVPWLWPDRIPRSMLTLIVGDAGKGKSYITLDIASRLSRSQEWPDGKGTAPLGNTIILSAEEASEYIMRPRILAIRGLKARIRHAIQ